MMTPARRIATFAVIGVLAFAVVAAGLWFAYWKPARHVDAELGYSIQFSPEWEVWPPGDGANVRASRTLHGANGVISVLVSPVKGFPDAAAYGAWWIEATKQATKGFAEAEKGVRTTPAGTLPWTRYVFRTQSGDGRMQALQYFFIRPGKDPAKDQDMGFILSFTAATDMFERFRADFEQTVDTFRAWTPQAGSMTTAVP